MEQFVLDGLISIKLFIVTPPEIFNLLICLWSLPQTPPPCIGDQE